MPESSPNPVGSVAPAYYGAVMTRTGASTPGDPIDLLPDGVVVADGDGMVTVVSRVAGAYFAVDPAGVVGKPLADVLQLNDQDGNDWIACNNPYGGLATRTAIPEQSWLLPDGTESLVTARLHRGRRGGPVEAVAISIRSGRGRARLDRERSDLVATVAHELRSPLTGVKGFVHALLNRWDKLSDDQKKLMLTTVSVDADRLGRLIAELLDVARIDTGRLRLNRRPTDMALKAERVVGSLRHVTSRPIRLETEEPLPRADADPDKVVQVITNVVENAVRHGSGDVEVVVRISDDPDYVEVVVTDQGSGIPVELRERAFTKFWTGGPGGGSGLGLYIVHGLVRAHGGTVTLSSGEVGGARVSVTWPVVSLDE